MSTPETIKAQLRADIATANATTGAQDTTVHDAVQRLAAEHKSTVPEAAGLSEFSAEQYRVAGDDLREVAAAIAQKSGIPAPVWPEGFAEAVAGIKEPEEVFYTHNGVAYTKNMVIPVDKPVLAMNGLYSHAIELESVALPNANSTGPTKPSLFGASTFDGCAKLRTAELPKAQFLGHYVFRNCLALESVQIGSIGFGATSIGSLCFYGSTQKTMHITVYVADDAALPLANSPWGATNATVIYRSATTGEVMEV